MQRWHSFSVGFALLDEACDAQAAEKKLAGAAKASVLSAA